MSGIRKYARNIFANWVGYAANLAVMFFLSPFVVHSLGEVQYGVWTLLVSLTGYLGLVEMGTRAGLGRHITFYLGKNDIDKVNGFLNTAMVLFLACGAVLLLLAAALGMCFGSIFSKVPGDLIVSARWAIFLTALNLWLSFFSAAFTQVLTASERFDLSNLVNIAVLVPRTAGTVLVLWGGGGIVDLAAVQAGSTMLGVCLTWLLARRVLLPMRLKLGLASWAHFRELFGFSIWAFVGGVAMQLLYWTDTVLIAFLLGPEMVTFYAIPSMLILHSRGLVGECASVFSPAVLKGCAQENWAEMRYFVKRSSNMVMTVAIPLLAGLIVFGKDFIRLWMGPKFDISYPVLAILAMAQLPAVGTMVLASIFSGLNKVRLAAILTIIQGVLNLGLTLGLVMVFQMGINGVAWGALVPRVVFGCICGWLALRWIGIKGTEFLKEPVMRWVIAMAGLAGIWTAMNAVWATTGWYVLAAKAAMACAAYAPLAWSLLLTAQDRARWQSALLARVGWAKA